MNTLGSRIALHRNMHHWTQDKLASDLGIAQGMLSDIENNKVSPKWDMINRIATVLEVPVLDLLPLQDTPAQQSPPAALHSLHDGNMVMLMEALLRSKEDLLRAKEETIAVLKQKLALK